MIDPTTGQEQPHPLESMIESTILQNEELKEQGSETNSLLEAIALQTQENDPEPILGAMIENDNQNTEKLVGAIKELKPELEKSASSTDRMVNFLEQMKGEPGHTPTEEELLALIEPRIPKVKDGEDGHTPTSEELVELIEPLVDEKMPTDEKLLELILPNIPPPIKPRDGIDGQDADEDIIVEKVLKKIPKPKPVKEIKLDTGEEIVTKLEKLKGNKRLDKSAIKGLDKMQKEIDHVASFGSSGQEYRIAGTKVSANSQTLNFIAGSNTTITGAPTADGANITITATGGGGGAVDSVNGQTGVVVLDQDDIGDGTTYKQYSQTEKTKLAGIETGAEVNTIDTVSDTTEIDLAITARDLTATIRSGSIDETKLDTSVNASLDLADSALQSSAIGVSVQAYSSVLANTTASFTTTDETKLDNITVTQAVDLDQMEADINALANGMVYKGNWDASAGTFPGAGSAQTGWFYTVSVGGTVNSVVFNVGDRLIATTDNASTTTYAGNWTQLDATDAVTSVFGRTGNVTATNGDYTASNITNVPAGNIVATDVQSALNELDTEKGGLAVANTWTAAQSISTNTSGQQIFLGTTSGGYGYWIGRNSSTGFLDFVGTQGSPFDGIQCAVLRASSSITINGENVIRNWSGTLGLGSGSGTPGAILEVRGGTQDFMIGGGPGTSYVFQRNSGTGFMEITGQQSGYTGYIFNTANGTNAHTINDSGNNGFGVAIGSILAKVHVGGTLLAQKLVEANTAGSGSPNIITSTESGSLYTNEGATALNYHTLPTAVAGLTYTFYVDDADGIRVTANTGDIIQINGVASASAGYAECTAIGGCLTLTAINSTDWVATSVIGSWSLT